MAWTFQSAVAAELCRARQKHGKPLNSMHEAYAVLLEEIEELWEEIRLKREQRSVSHMTEELVQIAAVCQRTAEDVLFLPGGPRTECDHG